MKTSIETSLRGKGTRTRTVGGALLLPALVLAFLLAASGIASGATSGDFDYQLIGGGTEVEITKYHGPGGAVVVPDMIEGRPVTAIGINAFRSYANLTSISLPDSLTRIGSAAFFECTSLTSIAIPANVKTLEDFAFYDCTSLTSVTMPDGVTSIGYNAFQACTSLTSVMIPGGLTALAEYTFQACTSLTSVTIPENVTSIGTGAFSYCSSLTSVAILGDLKTMSDTAFFYCTALTSINVPYGVTYIGNSTFQYCTSLPSVTMPDSLVSIGAYCFSWCQSLTSVAIPGNVALIGNGAFDMCTSLTSVAIPDGVSSIGDSAFHYCIALPSVAIPGSVASIGNNAFQQCTSLTSASIAGGVESIGNAAFWQCTSLSSVTIPGSVTSIGGSAFKQCSSLTNVSMSQGLTSIGEGAFSFCTSLTNVTIPGSVTSIGIGAFSSCPKLTSIDVNPGNVVYASIDGVLYDKPINTLIKCPEGRAGVFIIPGSVTSIQEWSFTYCALTSITIPGSVTSIGIVALSSCPVLTQVLFLGDAPACDPQWCTYYNPELTIYYVNGSSGFTTPTWYGIETVRLDLPSAPQVLQAVAGDRQVALSWQPPSSDGGAPVINYTIYRSYVETGGPGDLSLLATVGNVTAYIDSGLTNGWSCSYYVRAANMAGEGALSGTVATKPNVLPPAPTNLTASPSVEGINLTWSAGPGSYGVDSWNIYRGVDPGGEALIGSRPAGQDGEWYLDLGAVPGVVYSYRVSAVNNIGEGAPSVEVSAIIPVPPSAPLDLALTVGDQQVALSWDPPGSDGGAPVTNYTIYRGTATGEEALLIRLGPVLNHTDPGLVIGQTYYYRVSASNSAGEGNLSEESSATAASRPSEPRGLTAFEGYLSVTLNWTEPSYLGPGTVTYHLFRDGTEVWNGTVTAYYDAALTKGVQHSYVASASNSIGQGSNCTAVLATPFGVPDAPWGIAAISGDASIALAWNAGNYSGPGDLTYHLFRGGAEVWSGNATTHNDTGLSNGQAYEYKVAASNSAGWSENSSSASATPEGAPSAPLGLNATVADGLVELDWDAPSYAGPGTLTYHLFRNGSLVWSGTATGHQDSDVTNFVTYLYKVSASNSLGWGPNSTEIQATPMPEQRPSAPRGLSAIPGNENMTLSWEEPAFSNASAVTGYMISYGTSPGSMTNQITWGQLTYVLEGLVKGQTYYFSVAAQNLAGWGSGSEAIAATPFGVPSEPVGLTARAGDSYVQLSWNGTSYGGPGILTYHLFRGGALLWSGPSIAYNDTTAVNGVAYSYSLAAQNAVGWGTNSSVSATPLSPPVPPGAPTGIHIVEGEGRLTLNWTAPDQGGSSPISGYNLYRGTASGSLSWLAFVPGTTYVDSNVTAGQSYYYGVAAVSSAGEGEMSLEVEGGAKEDEEPPPFMPLDQWPTQLAIGLTVLAIVAIGALVVQHVKKKAARRAEGFVDCPRCGEEVPPGAHNCPKCNAHIRGPR